MKALKVQLPWAPMPNTTQALFVDSTAPAPAFMGPAQIGKTTTGAVKVLRDALTHPGAQYVIVSPTYRTHALGTAVPKYLALIPPALGRPSQAGELYRVTEQRIELANGASLRFSSAEEGDRYYGPSVRITHLDEPGLFESSQIFDIAVARSDQVIATFTPKGDRSHWTAEIWGRQYEQALEDLRQGGIGFCDHECYPVFTMTMEQNLAIPKQRLEVIRQRATVSWLAKREYTGEYLELSGPVYDSFSETVHVQPYDGKLAPVTAGVDLGTSAATCVVVAGRTESGGVHWKQEIWMEKMGMSALLRTLRELTQHYPGIRFFVDPGDSGRETIRSLRRQGLPTEVADNSVHNRVTYIWELLALDGSGRPSLTIDPSCIHVIDQMRRWRWRGKRAPGEVILWSDVERHAHAVDAAGYATLGLRSTWEPIPVHWRGVTWT